MQFSERGYLPIMSKAIRVIEGQDINLAMAGSDLAMSNLPNQIYSEVTRWP